MHVLVRADASPEMGAGHVMRCITICDALGKRGAQCTFIARSMPASLAQQLRRKGHELKFLPPISAEWRETGGDLAHSSWLGTNQIKDAEDCLQSIEDQRFDWLIVDHYALDHRFENAMRHRVRNVLAIDDLADRRHCCELLLDQNLGRQNFDYSHLVHEKCVLLTGSEFSLLRPEFSEFRQKSLVRRKNSNKSNILVSMGGFDSDNVTLEVLENLKYCEFSQSFSVNVILSSESRWLSKIRDWIKANDLRCELKFDVRNVAAELFEADIAIGAAGSSAWERCCLGVPTIIYVLASNQERIASSICEKLNMSVFRPGATAESFATALRRLMLDENYLACVDISSKLCDGLGTFRVVDELMRLGK